MGAKCCRTCVHLYICGKTSTDVYACWTCTCRTRESSVPVYARQSASRSMTCQHHEMTQPDPTPAWGKIICTCLMASCTMCTSMMANCTNKVNNDRKPSVVFVPCFILTQSHLDWGRVGATHTNPAKWPPGLTWRTPWHKRTLKYTTYRLSGLSKLTVFSQHHIYLLTIFRNTS
jgi:hypothetical protein